MAAVFIHDADGNLIAWAPYETLAEFEAIPHDVCEANDWTWDKCGDLERSGDMVDKGRWVDDRKGDGTAKVWEKNMVFDPDVHAGFGDDVLKAKGWTKVRHDYSPEEMADVIGERSPRAGHWNVKKRSVVVPEPPPPPPPALNDRVGG